MKKIMLMLFALAMASVNVMAQDDKDGKKTPEERDGTENAALEQIDLTR